MQFFVQPLPVAVARSSFDVNAISYVLPVLRMTSCFHTTGAAGEKEDYLYSAIYTMHSLKALRHGSHSLPANYTMPALGG